MSCPICINNFDDHVSERRCYNICSVCGYAVCKTCTDLIHLSCPSCRGPLRANPVFTRVNNAEPIADGPMELVDDQSVVLLIDISGSMGGESGTQKGAPTRIELAVHLAKVILAFCRKLKIKCAMYTFSEGLNNLTVTEKTSVGDANRILEEAYPGGTTNLGVALKKLFEQHGNQSKYFVFTDGDPQDKYDEAVAKFSNTQLHLIAFSNDVSPVLLSAIGNNPLHTISYIEDVRSLIGYMIPVFIWAMTDMKRVVLSNVDEQCRKKFVEILERQVSWKCCSV